MTKAIFEDLEPVSNLISRCEDCGDCFATEHQLNMHITHAYDCGSDNETAVEGINHKSAMEW